MAYRKPISPPEPTCTDAVECALSNPDPVALLALLAAASLVLLFVTIALAHIAGARSLLDEERERVAAEAEAFAAFARRVADLEASAPTMTDGGSPGTAALGAPQPDDDAQEVRDAYRDTVMSVPHYEVEYDESLATNMSLEFGEDVAGAVADGRRLTPQLKGTLIERSRTAHRQRVALLRQLESEAEALDDAAATLARVRQTADRFEDEDLERLPFEELQNEWRLLGERKATAESVLADRQAGLNDRDREARTRPGGPSFEEYLYGPLEVTHPVLSEGATLVERIEDARRRVQREIASRT